MARQRKQSDRARKLAENSDDPHRRHRHNKPPDAVTLQREIEVWDLAIENKTHKEIAEAVGLKSVSAVGKVIKRYGAKLAAEHSMEILQERIKEGQRLEKLAATIQKSLQLDKDGIIRGEARFLRDLIEVRKQYREVWGINTPTKTLLKGNLDIKADATVRIGRFRTREEMAAEIRERLAGLKPNQKKKGS